MRFAQRFSLGLAAAVFAACSSSTTTPPSTTPSPSSTPSTPAPLPETPPGPSREGLKAGLANAAEATWNLRVTAKAAAPAGFAGITNSDLAFTGNYAIQGNYNGLLIWDISNPSNPSLVTAYPCPASQNDVSVFRNLLFMSAEAFNGRTDCSARPFTQADSVSSDRIRGIRIFDISDIKSPKLVANVQTCRGSHTHTLVEDPNDRQNVYIYVSGSAPVRSSSEMRGCVAEAPDRNPNSSLMKIEIIRVPLANPAQAAIVSTANIFAGLNAPPAHGPTAEEAAIAARAVAAAKAAGGFVATNPQNGQEFVVNPGFINIQLDSIVKARGGTGAAAATAADTAAIRGALQRIVAAAIGPAPSPNAPVSVNRQCHDITVYPALGIAGGACEGHGLLLDISNPTRPTRIAAVSDSNFAYWHSATLNNDGTKILFSDEWGGGGSPKCRPSDPKEWGADAIFTIEDRQMKFKSYYKLPAKQTNSENCVAHNGNLIPIPGRDVMVQAWYQGGISVFDWTDASNPKEIAYFDRGPVDSTRMQMGGSWSVYWYNGAIVSSEIARGLDVAELTPSAYISQNEIDAAKTVRLPYLNAQTQPKMEWPPSFPLARAYVDQLERNRCLSANRIESVRQSLAQAERATGTQRSTTLNQIVSGLESDLRSSCDQPKIKTLQKAITDLSRVVMQ